jgi:Flp pilus assembly protein CpaB
MTIANKNDANKEDVLAALATVRQALENGPETAEVARALDQCGRLEVAIRQFHAEGIRFAAFTLLRMVLSHGTDFTEPVQLATRALNDALEVAGFPH